MSYLLTSLREHPELAIFLTLAIGFVIGRIKIGSFKFGNVLGTLIAGVLIGQLDIKVDADGQVGLLLAVPVCHRLQGWTAVLSRLEEECGVPGRADGGPLRDQPGDDAGGGEAAELRHRDRGRPDGRRVHRIDGDRHRQRHDRPARSARGREDETEEQHSGGLCGQLPRGHRLRRLVSVGRGATPASRRHEGREQETGGANGGRRRRLGPGSSPGLQGMEHSRLPAGRRPRRAGPWAISKQAAKPERVFVERIRRGTELLDAPPTTVLQSGDVLAIGARRRVLLSGTLPLLEELEDPKLLDFPMATLDVVVTKPGRRGANPVRPCRAARAGRHPEQIDSRRRRNSFRCRRRSSIAGTCFACPAPSGTSSASAASWATSSVPRVNRTSCSSASASSSAVSSGC